MADGAALDADGIAHYFAAILGRAPENEAVVQHYLRMGLSAEGFVRVLLDSEEVSERYRRRLALLGLDNAAAASWPERPQARRVLLFGAYGNGNLGDAAQAEALAGLLGDLLPGPLSLAACSWERRAPFAFPQGVRLAPDALLRAEVLPPPTGPMGPGLVVIGGGGVLGAPHFPLHAAAWARWFAGRGVPWALLGVGGSAEALAEPAWATAYRLLLQGAAFVGVRDAATLAATAAITPRAAWFPDPVLARALLAPEPSVPMGARPLDALVIPRHPNGALDAAANRAALAWRQRLLQAGRRVVVAAMERGLDAAALPGEEVVYVDDWAELMRLCRGARVLVSLRLHGVIAGLAAGCLVHGLVQPKIGDLMQSLGVGAWFAPGPWPEAEPDLAAAAAEAFHAALAPGLARLRTRLAAAMAQARAALAGAG